MTYPIVCNECGTQAKTTLWGGRCYWCGSHNLKFKEVVKMENPNVVYGLFNNTGDGIEHYWHFGVHLTEEDAYERWKNLLDSGFWIDEIEVK